MQMLADLLALGITVLVTMSWHGSLGSFCWSNRSIVWLPLPDNSVKGN